MKTEPSTIEKIRDLPCLEEVKGFEQQVKAMGVMTDEVQAAIATRRAELQRHNLKR